jgi:voltage-gated potassium channel
VSPFEYNGTVKTLQESEKRPESGWRRRLHEVVFEAETRAGRAFDIVLLWSILFSVVVVMVESVPRYRAEYGDLLFALEWFFTLLFTIEYALRLASVRYPLRYATSFFGVVDLCAILPGYLSLLLPGSQYLLVVRVLRVIRVFRIFKLTEHLYEAEVLMIALRASRRKIMVFLTTVLAMMVIIGSLMYVVEGEEHGFTSIPTSVYWAIVTMTTVGYGDLSPKTPLGMVLASAVMILGFGIIAIPTGIVTSEISRAIRKPATTEACPACGIQGHDLDAVFCKYCAAALHE